MKRLLILVVASFLSMSLNATTNAGSGQKWYGPFTLSKVARYYDGNGTCLSVHIAETPTTTCSTTNHKKIVSYCASAGNEDFANTMFSISAAAQAQNKTVNLLLDGNCSTTYGLNLHGVEILSN